MLDDFIQLIPHSLLNQPGSALDSGRQAFAGPSDIYLIGYHPGGQAPETIGEQIDGVLNRKATDWSAYRDEVWDRPPPGGHRIQKRIVHLCTGLELNPRAVPASHLIFRRWHTDAEPSAAEKQQWAAECWPFHQAVIDRLGVKVIVCLGSDARNWVLRKERELTGLLPQRFDSFTAKDKGAWSSYAFQSGSRYIVALTHPARANWINPNADPTELVKRTLAKARAG